MPPLRTWLALSRPSNLPTIWSNCLAGWWLGGAGHDQQLPFLLAGATLLYLGGAFLNDAFDADFDREHRRTAPIPSGAISRSSVLILGLLGLLAGCVSLFLPGPLTGGLGLALLGLIVLHNGIHRLVTFSPVLLAACRFLLYLAAASAAQHGVTGWSLWCGLVLAVYVIGLGFIANWKRAVAYWPLLCLASPVLLALVMNSGSYREGALLLSAVLLLWSLRSLRPFLWSTTPDLPRAIDGLTAGIVFVDWLAVADASKNLSFALIGLFLLTVTLQRLAPLTISHPGRP